ncbi:hypothetical protein J2T09_003019 [Neorhizobium huautlense]|uniref:Uncharacterized protein n=1 Tax=Neorhizobium huautlense TaxID=67774 RepID=A0ABT9PUV3_9HYPH|nr:hypothetical protein [Neorhizobium huautlense]
MSMFDVLFMTIPIVGIVIAGAFAAYLIYQEKRGNS